MDNREDNSCRGCGVALSRGLRCASCRTDYHWRLALLLALIWFAIVVIRADDKTVASVAIPSDKCTELAARFANAQTATGAANYARAQPIDKTCVAVLDLDARARIESYNAYLWQLKAELLTKEQGMWVPDFDKKAFVPGKVDGRP